MPDWTYRPVFRPVLFRMAPARAQGLTLAAIGMLARAPFGGAVIEAFGHMRPPGPLRRSTMGLAFDSPVGLGAGLDPNAKGLLGLARFGFGFVEAGPVTVEAVGGAEPERVDGPGIRYPEALASSGAASLAKRLGQDRISARTGARVGIRIAPLPGATAAEASEQLPRLIAGLAEHADFFIVQLPDPLLAGYPAAGGADSGPQELAALQRLLVATAQAATAAARPLLLCIPPDLPPSALELLLAELEAAGLAGAVVGGGAKDARGGRLTGAGTREASLATVRQIAGRWRGRMTVIGSGGIMTPADALALLEAGADLVQLHSGLVFSGPGLPKRINEALLWQAAERDKATEPEPRMPGNGPKAWPTWLGFLFLGLSMIIAGAAAWGVAATWVVLPYDLAYLGLDRAAVADIHPRLLPFMRHDRTSLAGTMISIGVLYSGLAWFGVRRGVHWARRALIASALPGFASFFLFLAHGYFDPLHATLSFVLFAMFLVGLLWPAAGPPEVPMPDLADDGPFGRSLVAQLLTVSLASGLIIGGMTITYVGSRQVFVPSDLVYIGRSAAELAAVNVRLVPLIAHDRAGFGGALVSDGIALLTLALWGFRRGARWVWWTIALSGLPGLAAGIGVHLTVGYLDFWHLSPALLALLLYGLALGLSWGYLGAGALSRSSLRSIATSAGICVIGLLAAGCARHEGQAGTRQQFRADAPLGAPATGAPVMLELGQDEVLDLLQAQVREELPGVSLQNVVAKKMTYADYLERVDRAFDGQTVDELVASELARGARRTNVWAVGYRSAGEVWEMSWFLRPPPIIAMEDARPMKYRGDDGLATGCMALDAVRGDPIAVNLAPSDWIAAECYDRLLSFKPLDD